MRKKTIFILMVLGLAGIILACRGGVDWNTGLVFSPNKLPAASVGQPYTVTILVSQNKTPVMEMGLAKGGLPDGLKFQFNQGKNSATISGTPKSGGNFTFDVGAACYGTNTPGQTGYTSFILSIAGPTATLIPNGKTTLTPATTTKPALTLTPTK